MKKTFGSYLVRDKIPSDGVGRTGASFHYLLCSNGIRSCGGHVPICTSKPSEYRDAVRVDNWS